MEQNTQTIEDALDQKWDSIPEEVQDFLVSPGYELILTAISEGLKLNPEETNFLKEGAVQLVIRNQNMEALALEWKEKGLTPEKIIQMLYAIDAEIITRATQIAAFYSEESEGDTQRQEGESIEGVLETLAQRLAETKVTPLTKRDYSLEKPTPPTQKASKESSVDPYREIPEV